MAALRAKRFQTATIAPTPCLLNEMTARNPYSSYGACLVCLLVFLHPGLSEAQPKNSATHEDILAGDYVGEITIGISRENIAALSQSPRVFVRATVREGATVYTNVAIRLKAGVGSFRPVDQNPALTLKFDKFTEGQTFHGFKKIHLNNSVQDPTLLCEKLGRDLFLKAGVPTPRVAHAHVRLNGRDLGMYVLLEAADKQFLKRRFVNAKGNLYDGLNGRDINEGLPVNSGDNPADHTDLRQLMAAANEPELTRRLGRLEKVYSGPVPDFSSSGGGDLALGWLFDEPK